MPGGIPHTKASAAARTYPVAFQFVCAVHEDVFMTLLCIESALGLS